MTALQHRLVRSPHSLRHTSRPATFGYTARRSYSNTRRRTLALRASPGGPEPQPAEQQQQQEEERQQQQPPPVRRGHVDNEPQQRDMFIPIMVGVALVGYALVAVIAFLDQ